MYVGEEKYIEKITEETTEETTEEDKNKVELIILNGYGDEPDEKSFFCQITKNVCAGLASIVLGAVAIVGLTVLVGGTGGLGLAGLTLGAAAFKALGLAGVIAVTITGVNTIVSAADDISKGDTTDNSMQYFYEGSYTMASSYLLFKIPTFKGISKLKRLSKFATSLGINIGVSLTKGASGKVLFSNDADYNYSLKDAQLDIVTSAIFFFVFDRGIDSVIKNGLSKYLKKGSGDFAKKILKKVDQGKLWIDYIEKIDRKELLENLNGLPKRIRISFKDAVRKISGKRGMHLGEIADLIQKNPKEYKELLENTFPSKYTLEKLIKNNPDHLLDTPFVTYCINIGLSIPSEALSPKANELIENVIDKIKEKCGEKEFSDDVIGRARKAEEAKLNERIQKAYEEILDLISNQNKTYVVD